MLAITKIVLEARDYDFLWTNHAKTNFQCLQEYLVPIEKDCKHIWFVLVFRLQANSVIFETYRLHPY